MQGSVPHSILWFRWSPFQRPKLSLNTVGTWLTWAPPSCGFLPQRTARYQNNRAIRGSRRRSGTYAYGGGFPLGTHSRRVLDPVVRSRLPGAALAGCLSSESRRGEKQGLSPPVPGACARCRGNCGDWKALNHQLLFSQRGGRGRRGRAGSG